MAKPNRTSPLDVLSIGKDIIPLIGAGIGITYALGFIIVNIHLSVYGIYEPGLLRVRYLGSGILFIVIVAMAAVPIVGEVRRILVESDTPGPRTDLVRLAKVLAQCVFLAGLLTCLAGSIGSLMSPGQTYWSDWAKEIATSVAVWLVMTLLPSAAVAIWVARQWRTQRPSSTSILFSVVCMGFGILVIYAAMVYPVLPPPVGGGASLNVYLLFDPDHADDFKRLGIPLQDANLSGPLCLMDETDKVYIVHFYEQDACGKGAIEIDRRAVLGVLYAPEEPP